MVGTFLALALGQLLIGPAEIETAGPFNAIVALFAVALVMVSTTRAEPPRLTAAATLPYGERARGIRRGRRRRVERTDQHSFYALVPAWMQDEGIARETIAMSMLSAAAVGDHQLRRKANLGTEPLSRAEPEVRNPSPSSGKSTNFRFLSRRRRLLDRMISLPSKQPLGAKRL